MGCCINKTNVITRIGEPQKVKIKPRHKDNIPNIESLDHNTSHNQRGSIFQMNEENIFTVYDLTKKIGSGYFGTVKLGHPKNEPNKIYAIKSIDKFKLTFQKKQNLLREMEILATLDHPNIIKYYETYSDLQYFHIVTEYLPGGELLEKISHKKRLTESEASNIIFQILSGISHCHNKGIVHRDLKPENILFENKLYDSGIKIIDFGLSRTSDGNELSSVVGSPYYVAPEVLEGKYDSQCDIWCIGVIMYFLLSGKPPFFHENKAELFKKIKHDHISFQHEIWKNISLDAIKLIKSLLNKDPRERPRAQKILTHSWFLNKMDYGLSPRLIDPDIVNAIRFYKRPKALIRVFLRFIGREAKSSEIENFKKMFILLDINKTGYIELSVFNYENEMRDTSMGLSVTNMTNINNYLNCGSNVNNNVTNASEVENNLVLHSSNRNLSRGNNKDSINNNSKRNTINNTIKNFKRNYTHDYSNKPRHSMQKINKNDIKIKKPLSKKNTMIDNRMEYSLFIAIALKSKNLLSKSILGDTFKYMDIYNTGYITVENFGRGLKRMGKSKRIEDIEAMFLECGYNSNSKIDFTEFCNYMDRCL